MSHIMCLNAWTLFIILKSNNKKNLATKMFRFQDLQRNKSVLK